MHAAFRRAIRKSQKEGVTVRACLRGELKEFYQMHLKLRKTKYRLFPQPFHFFDDIWQAYMENNDGVLLGAYDKSGRLIAGTLFLVCGNTLYYKFNTSDLNSLDLRANNILLWEGIRFAKARNLEYLDLGSSGYEQHGLIAFKSHAGAAVQDITHLGFTPPGYTFSQKRILRFLTRFFTLPFMPDFMLRLGSRLIYHYLA
jgi:lipid II:glycine glycyltransferase (peptidoglycan interpeptide bridge formation enzyme)